MRVSFWEGFTLGAFAGLVYGLVTEPGACACCGVLLLVLALVLVVLVIALVESLFKFLLLGLVVRLAILLLRAIQQRKR